MEGTILADQNGESVELSPKNEHVNESLQKLYAIIKTQKRNLKATKCDLHSNSSSDIQIAAPIRRTRLTSSHHDPGQGMTKLSKEDLLREARLKALLQSIRKLTAPHDQFLRTKAWVENIPPSPRTRCASSPQEHQIENTVHHNVDHDQNICNGQVQFFLSTDKKLSNVQTMSPSAKSNSHISSSLFGEPCNTSIFNRISSSRIYESNSIVNSQTTFINSQPSVSNKYSEMDISLKRNNEDTLTYLRRKYDGVVLALKKQRQKVEFSRNGSQNISVKSGESFGNHLRTTKNSNISKILLRKQADNVSPSSSRLREGTDLTCSITKQHKDTQFSTSSKKKEKHYVKHFSAKMDNEVTTTSRKEIIESASPLKTEISKIISPPKKKVKEKENPLRNVLQENFESHKENILLLEKKLEKTVSRLRQDHEMCSSLRNLGENDILAVITEDNKTMIPTEKLSALEPTEEFLHLNSKHNTKILSRKSKDESSFSSNGVSKVLVSSSKCRNKIEIISKEFTNSSAQTSFQVVNKKVQTSPISKHHSENSFLSPRKKLSFSGNNDKSGFVLSKPSHKGRKNHEGSHENYFFCFKADSDTTFENSLNVFSFIEHSSGDADSMLERVKSTHHVSLIGNDDKSVRAPEKEKNGTSTTDVSQLFEQIASKNQFTLLSTYNDTTASRNDDNTLNSRVNTGADAFSDLSIVNTRADAFADLSIDLEHTARTHGADNHFSSSKDDNSVVGDYKPVADSSKDGKPHSRSNESHLHAHPMPVIEGSEICYWSSSTIAEKREQRKKILAKLQEFREMLDYREAILLKKKFIHAEKISFKSSKSKSPGSNTDENREQVKKDAVNIEKKTKEFKNKSKEFKSKSEKEIFVLQKSSSEKHRKNIELELKNGAVAIDTEFKKKLRKDLKGDNDISIVSRGKKKSPQKHKKPHNKIDFENLSEEKESVKISDFIQIEDSQSDKFTVQDEQTIKHNIDEEPDNFGLAVTNKNKSVLNENKTNSVGDFTSSSSSFSQEKQNSIIDCQEINDSSLKFIKGKLKDKTGIDRKSENANFIAIVKNTQSHETSDNILFEENVIKGNQQTNTSQDLLPKIDENDTNNLNKELLKHLDKMNITSGAIRQDEVEHKNEIKYEESDLAGENVVVDVLKYVYEIDSSKTGIEEEIEKRTDAQEVDMDNLDNEYLKYLVEDETSFNSYQKDNDGSKNKYEFQIKYKNQHTTSNVYNIKETVIESDTRPKIVTEKTDFDIKSNQDEIKCLSAENDEVKLLSIFPNDSDSIFKVKGNLLDTKEINDSIDDSIKSSEGNKLSKNDFEEKKIEEKANVHVFVDCPKSKEDKATNDTAENILEDISKNQENEKVESATTIKANAIRKDVVKDANFDFGISHSLEKTKANDANIETKETISFIDAKEIRSINEDPIKRTSDKIVLPVLTDIQNKSDEKILAKDSPDFVRNLSDEYFSKDRSIKESGTSVFEHKADYLKPDSVNHVKIVKENLVSVSEENEEYRIEGVSDDKTLDERTAEFSSNSAIKDETKVNEKLQTKSDPIEKYLDEEIFNIHKNSLEKSTAIEDIKASEVVKRTTTDEVKSSTEIGSFDAGDSFRSSELNETSPVVKSDDLPPTRAQKKKSEKFVTKVVDHLISELLSDSIKTVIHRLPKSKKRTLSAKSVDSLCDSLLQKYLNETLRVVVCFRRMRAMAAWQQNKLHRIPERSFMHRRIIPDKPPPPYVAPPTVEVINAKAKEIVEAIIAGKTEELQAIVKSLDLKSAAQTEYLDFIYKLAKELAFDIYNQPPPWIKKRRLSRPRIDKYLPLAGNDTDPAVSDLWEEEHEWVHHEKQQAELAFQAADSILRLLINDTVNFVRKMDRLLPPPSSR